MATYEQKKAIIEAGQKALSAIQAIVPGFIFSPINDTDFLIKCPEDETIFGSLITTIGNQYVSIKWIPEFDYRNYAPKRRWKYDWTDNKDDSAGFISFITGIQYDLGR